MSILLVLASLSTGSILTYYGISVISYDIYHTYLGFIVSCLVLGVVGVGIIALYL
jgi:hypothetical protein